MRAVFMGTPDFAVPVLDALVQAGHTVAGVFTQPDRPAGRHQHSLQPPPVKVRAQELGIPVFQPAKMRDGTALEILRGLDPETICVAAYGRILPREILDLPRYGCINVHYSLLPKYRGAAPVNWALIRGEKETGVTIMHMAEELDAGDIILQETLPIGENEGTESVRERLAAVSGPLLLRALEMLEAGTAPRIPQDPAKATLAPMLTRELSPVDWSRSAAEIHNQIRGLCPWPAASTGVLTGEPVRLFSSAVLPEEAPLPPGTVYRTGKEGIDVVCGDRTLLRILELQAPGKKRMSAGTWLQGHPKLR